RQIKTIEAVVEKKIDLREPYDRLLTEPGIGKILGLTVMLETGPIGRFAKVGNCVLLPEGFDQMDQQRQEEGHREQEERQQVPCLGFLGSR
ncbi:MAG TPA: hypothetical protein VLX29_10490, partial [Nitrospirota bacterium]|nr:hypothetical protein [Nitrospirota bacterium]